VFTILESFGSVYLFRRIENDLHCGDTSVLDRFQGFLNLFHTNAIVKNLEVLQLHSFTFFSAAGEGMRRDSWNRFKTGQIRWGQRAGWSIREVGKTLCVCRCGWRRHKYRAAANAYSKPFQRPYRSSEARGRRTALC
jgi:hypothetical protein